MCKGRKVPGRPIRTKGGHEMRTSWVQLGPWGPGSKKVPENSAAAHCRETTGSAIAYALSSLWAHLSSPPKICLPYVSSFPHLQLVVIPVTPAVHCGLSRCSLHAVFSGSLQERESDGLTLSDHRPGSVGAAWMSCEDPGPHTGPVGCAEGWYRQELLNRGTRMILHGGEGVGNACLLSL